MVENLRRQRGGMRGERWQGGEDKPIQWSPDRADPVRRERKGEGERQRERQEEEGEEEGRVGKRGESIGERWRGER
jgi:hypothetical protein